MVPELESGFICNFKTSPSKLTLPSPSLSASLICSVTSSSDKVLPNDWKKLGKKWVHPWKESNKNNWRPKTLACKIENQFYPKRSYLEKFTDFVVSDETIPVLVILPGNVDCTAILEKTLIRNTGYLSDRVLQIGFFCNRFLNLNKSFSWASSFSDKFLTLMLSSAILFCWCCWAWKKCNDYIFSAEDMVSNHFKVCRFLSSLFQKWFSSECIFPHEKNLSC